jgi:hypothetical protein
MAVGNRQADGGFLAVPVVDEPGDFCDYTMPEHLPRDPVSLYLRIRYSQRDQFFQQQNEGTKEKIRHEVERIAELKSVFASEMTNKMMLDNLREFNKAWKKSAKQKCRENKVYVRDEFGKDLTEIVERDRIERRRENKLKVLRRVEAADWDNPTVERNEDIPTVTGEPGYGFRMSKITLERGPSLNPPFQNYKLERFSIDEATKANSKKNPWKNDSHSTSDAIRYFHFPANDMQWIEVSTPKHF